MGCHLNFVGKPDSGRVILYRENEIMLALLGYARPPPSISVRINCNKSTNHPESAIAPPVNRRKSILLSASLLTLFLNFNLNSSVPLLSAGARELDELEESTIIRVFEVTFFVNYEYPFHYNFIFLKFCRFAMLVSCTVSLLPFDFFVTYANFVVELVGWDLGISLCWCLIFLVHGSIL